MARPQIGKNRWLSILSSIVLGLFVVSSPIRISQSIKARVNADSPSGKVVSVSVSHGAAFRAATPGSSFIDADRIEILEEDEDESSCTFCQLTLSAFVPPHELPKLRSSTLPNALPAKIFAISLRC